MNGAIKEQSLRTTVIFPVSLPVDGSTQQGRDSQSPRTQGCSWDRAVLLLDATKTPFASELPLPW